jgi:hypothetical protein
MRRPIGGAIAPANAALMVEQTVVSVGPDAQAFASGVPFGELLDLTR